MRHFLQAVICCFVFSLNLSGQADPEALKILDKFSDIAMKAPSVSMKFRLITNNQAENKIDTASGTVVISKDKYRLELPTNIIWYDGTTSWSYLPAEKEVTITKADKKDNSFQSKPSRIFTMYKKDYKCRLIDETSSSYIVDLYPVDIKSDMLRVRLTIGKTLYNLISLEYKRRDGVIATIKVQDYNLKMVPQPDLFTFKSDKYKDAEIVDMR